LKRPHLIILIAWLGICVGSSPGWACRYNVLEVGFIDLGIEPYRLFGYVTGQTPAGSVSAWRDEIELNLVDTNVDFELVHVDRDTDHAALSYLETHGIENFPAAVLVSPDGQSLPIASSDKGVAAQEVLDSILLAGWSTAVLDKAAGCYGVILVIEGPDETANALARDAAQAAVDHVAAQMEFMPKPIAHPPEVLTLPADAVAKEGLLLWSLDAEPADINEPRAAIFYGRGRWIGPLFRGEQITQENLEKVLFVIGADCECGLDHRWLQGTMLPARWDEGLQAQVAQTLGFDPESPMVKMEMVSIIRRGMGGAAVPGVPFGYREIEVGSTVAEPIEIVDEPAEIPEPESAEPEPSEPVLAEPAPHEAIPAIPAEVLPISDVNEAVPAEDTTVEAVSPMPVVALGLGGLAVCVIGVGLAVFMKSRQA